ncbi:hypothetical protein [Methylobacterium longum]|uniref:Uncharacterized protein n=1 Tax=Methylobacterium longum TaxID=767694 RepID=A0ABT8APP5_9HYPH|nr:hypothetical protein [Methylobacterium longum]MDN3571430.1 hypothetical protein [Methylobacterium longum]
MIEGALLGAAVAVPELPVEPVATWWAVPVEMLVEPLAPVPVPVVPLIVPVEPSAELGAPAEPVEVLLVFTEGAAVPAAPDELALAGSDEPVALVVDPDEPVVPAFAPTVDPAVVPVEFVTPVVEPGVLGEPVVAV